MSYPVNVPDGISGDWRVESFVVTDEDVRNNVRGLFRPNEYVRPGSYKRLMRGRTVVMSNTPMEVRTNRPILVMANGSVLLNGLGLGMVLTAALAKPEVTSVTVVENSEDVARLVWPTFSGDPRVKIVMADAMHYRPEKGVRFNAVWHDIWDYITAGNLSQMETLHRRYGRRTDWQGSWARDLCQRRRR
jgi:spermidine synthase